MWRKIRMKGWLNLLSFNSDQSLLSPYNITSLAYAG